MSFRSLDGFNILEAAPFLRHVRRKLVLEQVDYILADYWKKFVAVE